MQHGPILGHVDASTGEHGVPELWNPGGHGQLDEAVDGLVADPVLGEVDSQTGRLEREASGPIAVGVEQVPNGRLQSIGMLGKGLPLGELVDGGRNRHSTNLTRQPIQAIPDTDGRRPPPGPIRVVTDTTDEWSPNCPPRAPEFPYG